MTFARLTLLAVAAWMGGALPIAMAAEVPHETLKIDRVEIGGVTAFSENDIESALEIGPGDFVDRGKILKTAENIVNMYHGRGYESATVEHNLYGKKEHGHTTVILEYAVHEGLPTAIAAIRISMVRSGGSVLRKYWSEIFPKLQAHLHLKPGDLLDQEAIANARHALQEVLNAEEFIGARVEDVAFTAASTPTNLPRAVKAAKWEDVDFTVDLGDRVTFGFRGNHVVPASRLQAIIVEQKTIGLGKDYVEAIRTGIKEQYYSLGFAHVSVTAYPFERPTLRERHITYVIDEGPRVGIQNVHFDGNVVFSNDELRKEFFKKASAAVSNGYYVESDIQKAAQLTVEWIKSKGYLSAKLITINHAYVLKPRAIDTGKFVNVTIYLYEGEQTIVRKTEFIGNQAVSSDRIKQILGVHENEPLNLFTLEDGIENLKNLYRNLGYLSIRVANENTNTVVNYSEENRVADIYLEIVEGPQYKVGNITIEGLVATKEYVVNRELLFHKGKILKESEITGSEANLHRLGIFSVITIRATDDPDHDDVKNIKISLQEGTPGLVAGGVGFRNDLGGRVFGQVGYQNLWGENHTIALNLAANHRYWDFHFVEYDAELAYIWPWFFWDDTTFRPTATLTGNEYINFDAVTAELALNWERKLLDKPNLTGLFSYTYERVIQFNAINSVDNQGVTIGSVTPELRLDLRNSALNPTSGFFASASYELASPYLGSQHDPFPVGYTMTQLQTDYYQPIYDGVDLYLSFRTGYERSLEQPVAGQPTSGAIPLIKQFALGGIDSVRGYQDEEINLANQNIYNASFVNYRTELDFPFAGSLKLGGFMDAANLQPNTYGLTQNLLYGAGVDVRYDTPVGPINLDWGFKLNPIPGTDTNQFYFSVGAI